MHPLIWITTLSLAFVYLTGCFGGSSSSEPVMPTPPSSSSQDAQLLYKDNLVYAGAFRVPSSADNDGFAYGGTAIGYNPVNHSLFMVGHDWYQLVGEISIPEAKSGDINTLNRSTLLQNTTDATHGQMDYIAENREQYLGADGVKVGGLLPWQGELLGSVYGYYDAEPDADGSAYYSHFKTSVTLTNNTFSGMFKVGDRNPGFVGGYMAVIPENWRTDFGGPLLTGNAALAIISRTSFGPSASVFDPVDLSMNSAAPATMLIGYPSDHPTLGEWGNYGEANDYYGIATGIEGVAFPEGHRSVLFFGTHGLGEGCYGGGTDDQSKHDTYDGNLHLCFDPTSPYKGNHAYPYVYYVWAYDAAELVQVKQGLKQPWDIKPYAVWALDLPFATGANQIGGVAYDAVHQRLYISAMRADEDKPLIHVLEVR